MTSALDAPQAFKATVTTPCRTPQALRFHEMRLSRCRCSRATRSKTTTVAYREPTSLTSQAFQSRQTPWILSRLMSNESKLQCSRWSRRNQTDSWHNRATVQREPRTRGTKATRTHTLSTDSESWRCTSAPEVHKNRKKHSSAVAQSST